MYRGRLWTMRQFAGFGTVEETNERFRYLLDHGQTGLSTAFDMPTLMGLDSDHARSLGEVGVEGVALDTVDDMETLFDGIPLDEVTVSMTINAPAAILLAFYVVAAEEKGIAARAARRHDPDRHPQGVHRPEGVVLPDRAGDAAGHRHGRVVLRGDAALASDLDLRLPHPRGRLDRRSRSSRSRSRTASPTSSGRVERGLDVDDFAPRLSFFFNAHIDFFEEIAKYRAARRIWAREMRDTYGAKRPESRMLMRFHTQTAGVSLTAQQPLVNIVRTTIEALAGVLGGTQSLHTNSFDEALALPTEEAVRVALRTQQVIAHESGRHEHRRPARRLLLRREADRRDGGRRLRLLRPHRRARRHGRGDQAELPAARDRRRRLQLPARGRAEASGSWSASTPTGSTTRSRPSSTAPTRRPSASRGAPRGDPWRDRDDAAAEAALAALEARRRRGREPDAAAHRCARARVTEGEMIAAMQQVFGTYTETPVY